MATMTLLETQEELDRVKYLLSMCSCVFSSDEISEAIEPDIIQGIMLTFDSMERSIVRVSDALETFRVKR